jgi:hypothetical protein
MKKSLYYIAVLRTVWLPIFEEIKKIFRNYLAKCPFPHGLGIRKKSEVAK